MPLCPSSSVPILNELNSLCGLRHVPHRLSRPSPSQGCTVSNQHTATFPLGPLPLTLRRSVAAFGITVAGYITANLVPLMIVAMVDDLGMSQSLAGGVLTGSLLSCALTCLLTARLAAGARRFLLGRVGLLVMATAFAIAAVVPSVPVVCAAVVIGGLGAGGALAVGGASLAALKDPTRASGLSLLTNRSVITVVLALIPILGVHMTNAFGTVALLAAAIAVTVQWLPYVPVTPPELSETTHRITVRGFRPSRATATGIALLAFFAIWVVSEDSLWAVSGVMGADNAGLTEQQIGLVLSISTGGGILATLALTAIGNRLGNSAPIGVLLVLGAILKVASCFVTESPLYMTLIVASNTFAVATFAYFVAIAASLDVSGRWSGSILGTGMIGSSFAPLFATLVTQAAGYQTFGLILGIINLSLLVPVVVIARSVSYRAKLPAVPRETSSAEVNSTVG